MNLWHAGRRGVALLAKLGLSVIIGPARQHPGEPEIPMKLYMFPIAPNPTRVRLQLAEKGVQIEEVLVNLRSGEQRGAEHLARNPLGKLPVLELDDGSFLTESLAIMELIEELHPDPPTIGTDPVERAKVRSTHRISENALGMIALVVHNTNSPLGLPANPEIAAFAGESLDPLLAVAEQRIGDSPFLTGAMPTIADCTLFAGLNFGRFFGFELDSQYARLTRWFEAYGKRPKIQGALVLPG
jgi:glutathione S-transferase